MADCSSDLAAAQMIENGNENCCWICLDTDGDLQQPCACPQRYVHPKCLASLLFTSPYIPHASPDHRWQLRSAGRAEEHACRFCKQKLPDWRPVLTPEDLQPSAVPVVSVHFNGTCYKLRIKPGAEGYEQFRKSLTKITGVPMLDSMQITFQCKSPDNTAQDLCFKGLTAYDAAIHCAAVSASERMKRPRRRHSDGSTSMEAMQAMAEPSITQHNNTPSVENSPASRRLSTSDVPMGGNSSRLYTSPPRRAESTTASSDDEQPAVRVQHSSGSLTSQLKSMFRRLFVSQPADSANQ